MELFEYKEILEKYYEGSSSVNEETLLKEFLQNYQGNNQEFLLAKQLFATLKNENEETIDLDFDSLISKKPILKFKRPVLNYISGIAAALLVGVVITVLVKTTEKQVVYAYIDGKPITNKELALEYSKKALYDLSSQLNKGTKGLNYVNKINKPVELLTVKK